MRSRIRSVSPSTIPVLMIHSSPSKEHVTRILQRLNDGDRSAWQDLLLTVDEALRRMAGREMDRERDGHTLQATALIHEAFLRLDVSRPQFESRAHFFGAASRAMQQTLIEAHRRRTAKKRGGDNARVPLESAESTDEGDPAGSDSMLEELHRALDEMAARPRLARKLDVVRLLFIQGLSIAEAASELGASESTVYRDWRFARAWLYSRLNSN